MSEVTEVVKFTKLLFENQLEGYDPSAKLSHSKGVINPGGAKLFCHYNWNSPKRSITVNNEPLVKALSAIPGVVLFTLNRIQLDKEGLPVRVEAGEGYNRICHGLMAYGSFDADKDIGKKIKKNVIAATSSLIDLSGHVEVVEELEKELPDNYLACLRAYEFKNPLGSISRIKPHAAVVMAIPSGPAGSNAFWSYENNKIKSRAAMAASQTASAAEVGDLPF